MSLTQAGASLNSIAPFALNWRGLSGYRHDGSADQTVSSVNAASQRQQMSNDFGDNSAQVSLSDAARALSAFNDANTSGTTDSSSGNGGSDASGSSDFNQEAAYLGGVADASLVAMGIITPDQQAGTQITFDSLSYNVSSSASAGISQQNGQAVAEYGSQQQAEFIGQGHITTADGRTLDFQIEVDLDQSQQVEAATGSDALGNAQSGNDSAALAANGTPSTLPATSANASSGIASPTTASAGSINWDEILKESKSLIDLLESIGKANQADNTANPAALANVAAGNAALNQATTASSSAQGNGASSSDSQKSSQNSTQNAASPVTQAA
jgi:hypothetical protein